jgi:hypothetical protein
MIAAILIPRELHANVRGGVLITDPSCGFESPNVTSGSPNLPKVGIGELVLAAMVSRLFVE